MIAPSFCSLVFLGQITCHFLSAYLSHLSCEDLCGVSGGSLVHLGWDAQLAGSPRPLCHRRSHQKASSEWLFFSERCLRGFQGDSEHPPEMLRDTSQRMHLAVGMYSAGDLGMHSVWRWGVEVRSIDQQGEPIGTAWLQVREILCWGEGCHWGHKEGVHYHGLAESPSYGA